MTLEEKAEELNNQEETDTPSKSRTSSVQSLQASIKGGVLTIQIPVNGIPSPSASGKTLVIASSHGNFATSAIVNGKPVIIGLNAYIKK